MKRLILGLTILALAFTLVPAQPAVAQGGCLDSDGWYACMDLNDCDRFLLIRNRLECAKRCHFFYCV